MAKMGQHLILLFALAGLAFGVRPGDFKVLGPGGGGAMFNPTVSPHDPNTVLISCDMTGAYITHDGGQSWRMFNLRGVVRFFVFDPLDPKVMYAQANGLWRSTDAGETWNLVYPKPAKIKAIVMRSDHADEKLVADPVDGEEVPGFIAVVTELFAQLDNHLVQRAGGPIIVVAPDFI